MAWKEPDKENSIALRGEGPKTPPEKPIEDTIRDHEAMTARKINRGQQALKNVSPEKIQRNLEKARAVMALKRKERNVVKEKVAAGLPITEEERSKLLTRQNAKDMTEREAIARAAKLMIKPQSVNELRLLVETTAAKNHYNPIESLILQTKDPDIPEKEKIAIHKALLPFLVPQLPTPKPTTADVEDTGVRVTVTQFVFPSNNNEQPLHLQKPATVTVETPINEPSV